MPMSHDHRYLGKELIKFFGHRMGKSGATLLLSAASAHFSPSMRTQSLWSFVITAAWSGVTLVLSNHLAARNDGIAANEKDEKTEKANVKVDKVESGEAVLAVVAAVPSASGRGREQPPIAAEVAATVGASPAVGVRAKG